MSKRIISLDIMRGGTIAAMILVNTPGSWEYVYSPLLHASWHGITPTDFIFPLFLFIMGVSVSLSLKKYKSVENRSSKLWFRLLKRSFILFLIGLFLNGFPYFDFSTLRVPGVLQRISLVFLVTAFVFLKTNTRAQIIISFAVLVSYWVGMERLPFPGRTENSLLPESNLAAYIDYAWLKGHLWSQTKTWDPEGILSTLPAIISGLSGAIFGNYFFSKNASVGQCPWAVSMVTANVLILVGLCLDVVFPINKNLWTSSFVLLTSGVAIHLLLSIHWLSEKTRYWVSICKPFIHFGSNAIVAYVLSMLLATTLSTITVGSGSLYSWIYEYLFVPWADPYNASLAFALFILAIVYLCVWALDRRNIFIKV